MVESPVQPATAAAQATILVVDRFIGTRALIADVLQLAGYRCLLAGDGLQALDLVRRERPELVITGIRIPIVNGMGLLRYLRENDPDTAVLVMTSEIDWKVLAACYALGAVKVLSKPVFVDELLIRTKRALERRQLLIERRLRLAGR